MSTAANAFRFEIAAGNMSAAAKRCAASLAELAKAACSVHPIPLGHLIRQARERGDWNVARLPHKAVQDMIAQLQKAGDHDEACRVARESLHARIDRAADAASAATATMHIRVAGLKRCLGNNPEARMAIGMYRATCERERRFAICRVMRGEA